MKAIASKLAEVCIVSIFTLGILGAGCTSAPLQNTPQTQVAEMSARLVVHQAVARYIQARGALAPQTAARIQQVAASLTAVLDGNPETTVAALQAAALTYVPATFSPADKMLANDLIGSIGTLIGSYIGQGTLDPSKTVLVREAISWIAEGAAEYAPPH